jgi:hypothetical protein
MEGSREQAQGSSSAAILEDTGSRGGPAEPPERRLPPRLFERPRALQPILALLVPAAFGGLCGWVLGVSKVGYLVLAVPIAILGGAAAGFEHRGSREGALRGVIGGALFGGFILIVHELTGKAAKVKLPDPPIVLAAVTAVFGAGLGAIGGRWREDVEETGTVFDTSKLSPAEAVGMFSAGVLFGSLFLPWFSTSSSNPNSKISSAHIGPGESATAWQTFRLLDVALVLACSAPFILSWIIARGHALTWRPGEVTMIVGITAFVLILCNGIILGKPDPGIAVSIDYGYFVGLLGCVGMLVAGYLRQAVYTDVRKPPGVL